MQIQRIDLDNCRFYGKHFENLSDPNFPQICVELEASQLKRLKVNQIMTANYKEMTDGTWLMYMPGYLYPSFYQDDDLTIWAK